ncbi:hypothetical protein EDD21DRAFT_348793 [Dissophora ornata]|nr:hypothetical protein EDD21DRAFT_348793 [Dissophora ornata]
MEKQEELRLSRRQRTLSSISNYIPLHIVLNQPAGVSFSITVPKSFSIEQLARQIEAEYAFLVEREVGYSTHPVIECGALFDHVDLEPDQASVRMRRRRPTQKLQVKEGGTTKGISKVNEDDQPLEGKESEGQDEVQREEDNESVVDEREEAESRGVQLRFSDKVVDVLDRNSTVHVVNIDQGSCWVEIVKPTKQWEQDCHSGYLRQKAFHAI